MAKTQTELNEIKNNLVTVTERLHELSDDELQEITGGAGQGWTEVVFKLAHVERLYPHMVVAETSKSGGQRQRVAISKASIAEPAILIIEDAINN